MTPWPFLTRQKRIEAFSKHRHSWPMIYISQFVDMLMCFYVCLLFELPIKRLFGPTSQSQMTKIFRDSESWRKSNGNKWSQIWKLLLKKGCKIATEKKFVFGRILQGSGGFTTRIRRLYNKDQEVIQQGSGGFVFWRDYKASPENFWIFLVSVLLYPHWSRDALYPVCGIFLLQITIWCMSLVTCHNFFKLNIMGLCGSFVNRESLFF